MGKVVAITGGTGFVGRHLVARHLELGDTVRYLTRSGSTPIFPCAQAYVGNLCSKEGLTFLPQAWMYFITVRRNCMMRP